MKNEYLEKGEQVRKKFASLINAQPSEIAFVKNTSEGLNIAANGIKFNPGDNVIINELEHGSNVYPWINLRKKNVEVKIVRARKGVLKLEDIETMIDSKTRAISISSIQYQGYKIDLMKLSKICSENSVYLVVDAIQSLGNEPMDVKSLGIDIMSAQCHKGLLGPHGIGFFYCNEKIIDEIEPTYVSTSSYESGDPLLRPNPMNSKLTKSAIKFEYGCLNYIGYYAMEAALNMLEKVGIENISSRTFKLSENFRKRLKSLGIQVIDSSDVNERSHIVMFNLAGKDVKEVARLLDENKVRVSGRQIGLRASFGLYNSFEDVEKTLSILEKIQNSKR
jgi:selenocysteine lyase/cysteine desulfurase